MRWQFSVFWYLFIFNIPSLTLACQRNVNQYQYLFTPFIAICPAEVTPTDPMSSIFPKVSDLGLVVDTDHGLYTFDAPKEDTSSFSSINTGATTSSISTTATATAATAADSGTGTGTANMNANSHSTTEGTTTTTADTYTASPDSVTGTPVASTSNNRRVTIPSFEEWKKQIRQNEEMNDNPRAKRKSTRGAHNQGREIIDSVDGGFSDDVGSVFETGDPHGPESTADNTYEEKEYINPQKRQEQDQQANKKQFAKVPLKSLKERFNYAWTICAATVRDVNKEARGAQSILFESKDQYLLNKCSADKFVIINLCEEILIDTIVLANFEFFSSTFKDFRVYVANTYPTKEWQLLGQWQARNTRDLQVFKVQDSIGWFEYVKIEFLTHYGNEYYCPLSLVRVHGMPMLEYYNAVEYEGLFGKGESEGIGEQHLWPADVREDIIHPQTVTNTSEWFPSKSDVDFEIDDNDESALDPLADTPINEKASTNNDNQEENSALATVNATVNATIPVFSKTLEDDNDKRSKDTGMEAQPTSMATDQVDINTTTTSQGSTLEDSPASMNRSHSHMSGTGMENHILQDIENSAEVTETITNEPSIDTNGDEVIKTSDNDHGALAHESGTNAASLSDDGSNEQQAKATATNHRHPSSTTIDLRSEIPHAHNHTVVPTPFDDPKQVISVTSSNSTATTATETMLSSTTSSKAHESNVNFEDNRPKIIPNIHNKEPATQESIYKIIMKRLNALEANATLSQRYLDEQNNMLNDVFTEMEKRHQDQLIFVLDRLNETASNRIEGMKRRYEQSYAELKHQMESDMREMTAKISILTDQISFEKRVSMAQLAVVVTLFVFLALSRGTFNTLSPVMMAQAAERKRRESGTTTTSSSVDTRKDRQEKNANTHWREPLASATLTAMTRRKLDQSSSEKIKLDMDGRGVASLDALKLHLAQQADLLPKLPSKIPPVCRSPSEQSTSLLLPAATQADKLPSYSPTEKDQNVQMDRRSISSQSVTNVAKNDDIPAASVHPPEKYGMSTGESNIDGTVDSFVHREQEIDYVNGSPANDENDSVKSISRIPSEHSPSREFTSSDDHVDEVV